MSAEAAKEIGDLTQKIEDANAASKAGDQIAKLVNELDVLTGAATKGEIAMREALAGGATQEDAQTIRDLTDDLEERKKKEEKSKPDKASSKAANIGSQENAQIFLRGLGGGKDDATKEIQKSNQHLEQLVENTKQKQGLNMPTMLGSGFSKV